MPPNRVVVYASAAIWNILEKFCDLHKRSGIAVQWNGCVCVCGGGGGGGGLVVIRCIIYLPVRILPAYLNLITTFIEVIRW